MPGYSHLLKPDENILRRVNGRPSTSTLIVMSILLFGIPILYYLYSIRNQPVYLITDERVLEVKGDEIQRGLSYNSIRQIQVGKSWPEKFDKTGHMILTIDDIDYWELQYVEQYKEIAEEINTKIV